VKSEAGKRTVLDPRFFTIVCPVALRLSHARVFFVMSAIGQTLERIMYFDV
jgi:hypothetical protein